MRVRPVFWLLLVFSCSSVLVFAARFHTPVPAIMQVHLWQQPPVAQTLTTLDVHLADPQGLPIEEAQVVPSARMTNMEMEPTPMSVSSLGQGNYQVQLRFSMAGPWEIHIVAYADGFDSLQLTLFVQVFST